jgi:hypothetical protein
MAVTWTWLELRAFIVGSRVSRGPVHPAEVVGPLGDSFARCAGRSPIYAIIFPKVRNRNGQVARKSGRAGGEMLERSWVKESDVWPA